MTTEDNVIIFLDTLLSLKVSIQRDAILLSYISLQQSQVP